MDRPTILVVEDEPAIADTIQYALESEGFRCLRLEVGAGVTEVLDREPVALVVLDIGLPDMSGIEVCRRIRQKHDVPVIFLTARGGEMEELAVVGANRCLVGRAEAHCPLDHRVENWSEVAGRGVDDLQHLGGRGLLLQCLARLGQEPRILHRDDRLRRKVLQ